MDKQLYEEIFAIISDQIQSYPQERTHGYRRGYIIADDHSGEMLDFVKKNLRYDALKAAGRVHEITIDETWDHALRKKGDTQGREAWNELVAAAYKANHGLLVITISNIKMFGQCWKLKSLIKLYEDDRALEAIAPTSRREITPVDREFIDENVPEDVMYDGNVLLVVKDLSWDEVEAYAKKHDEGHFLDMFQFYRRLRWDEE